MGHSRVQPWQNSTSQWPRRRSRRPRSGHRVSVGSSSCVVSIDAMIGLCDDWFLFWGKEKDVGFFFPHDSSPFRWISGGKFFQTGMSKAPKNHVFPHLIHHHPFWEDGNWAYIQQVFIHHPPQVLPASSLAAWPTPKIWLHEWKDMVLEVRKNPPTVGEIGGGWKIRPWRFGALPVGTVQMYTGKKMCREEQVEMLSVGLWHPSFWARQLVLDTFATILPINIAESSCFWIVGRSRTCDLFQCSLTFQCFPVNMVILYTHTSLVLTMSMSTFATIAINHCYFSFCYYFIIIPLRIPRNSHRASLWRSMDGHQMVPWRIQSNRVRWFARRLSKFQFFCWLIHLL